MKILIISEADPLTQINGVVTTINNTIFELEELGHIVKLVTSNEFRTIACPSYPEIRLTINPWKIKKIIKEFKPDSVHICTEGPLAFYTAWYLNKINYNFTTSFHTRLPEYIHKRYPFISKEFVYNYLKKLHKNSKNILVTTQSMKDELEYWGFENLVIWGRGVDQNIFNSLQRVPINLKTKLLYVGRISVEKNLEAFLDLDLSEIYHEKIVVGDGPLLQYYMGKYPKVTFLGSKKALMLAKHYSNADVFVFPSLTDTFGLVMLESIACGTPVAAFPVTDPIDVIKEGITGSLNKDLKQAILNCMAIDRKQCELEAVNFNWKNTTKIFLDNLANIK